MNIEIDARCLDAEVLRELRECLLGPTGQARAADITLVTQLRLLADLSTLDALRSALVGWLSLPGDVRTEVLSSVEPGEGLDVEELESDPARAAGQLYLDITLLPARLGCRPPSAADLDAVAAFLTTLGGRPDADMSAHRQAPPQAGSGLADG